MEDHAVEDDDIDFSIIGPQNDKQKQVNFSVNELLTNPTNQQHQQQQQVNRSECIAQEASPIQGSFLRDLRKIQQSLSYETNPFDIFQPQQQFYQQTKLTQIKQQQDTCTRTLNNLTNITKYNQKYYEQDCKHLILDFFQLKQPLYKLTIKSNQDYCQHQILSSKRTSYKSDQQILTKSKLTPEIIPNQSTQNTYHPTIQSTLTNKKSNKIASQHLLKFKKSKSHCKILLNPILPSTQKKHRQSFASHKKSHSTSSLKQKTKKKSPTNHHKNPNHQNIQAFIQYYGCVDQYKNNQLKKNQKYKLSKSKSKSKQKNKKIIFSKKNVYSFH